MKFQVAGADRQTGEVKVATVDAADRDDAVKRAGKTMLVSEIHPLKPSRGGALVDITPPLAAIAGKNAPEYLLLYVGAIVVMVLASLAWLAAILLLIATGLETVSGTIRSMEVELRVTQISEAFASGAVLGILGGMALAVRDIARNSFGK